MQADESQGFNVNVNDQRLERMTNHLDEFTAKVVRFLGSKRVEWTDMSATTPRIPLVKVNLWYDSNKKDERRPDEWTVMHSDRITTMGSKFAVAAIVDRVREIRRYYMEHYSIEPFSNHVLRAFSEALVKTSNASTVNAIDKLVDDYNDFVYALNNHVDIDIPLY